jgi:transposase, IS6 family
VRVAGQWRSVYRAIDQFGQVIDVFVAPRRDAKAAHRFFERAIDTTKVLPVEVVTDRAATYPIVLEELLPAPWHRTEQYANNRVECDHGRLKARLRPMRGLKQDRRARVIIAGHAFVQNVGRGHYELAAEEPARRAVGRRVRGAGRGDLNPGRDRAFTRPGPAQSNSAWRAWVGGEVRRSWPGG